MSRSQIRANQLITTYGPGAMMDLPDKSVIIAGLDKWTYESSNHCIIEEPRLAVKVANALRKRGGNFKGVSVELRKPPPAAESIYTAGQITPGVTAYQFPHWFIAQKVEVSQNRHRRRPLVLQDQLSSQGRFRADDNKHYSVVPVRFVRACKNGHVGDIQWRDFVHHSTGGCRQDLWIEERGTTGDLSDVWIVCSCGASRSVSEAAEQGALGSCNGSRPWLDDRDDVCGEQNRLLVRTASNAYFPQTLPVISIPDSVRAVEAVVYSEWENGLKTIQNEEDLANIIRYVPPLAAKLEPFSRSDVLSIIQSVHAGTPSTGLARPVKQVEFDALSRAAPEHQTDQPDGDFFVRLLDPANWESPVLSSVERVVQVHRLREVVAMLGFTRFEPQSTDVTGELDIQVMPAPIARNTKWVPAFENRGEGVFIQFRPEVIDQWLQRPQVGRRSQHLSDSLEKWRQAHPGGNIQFPGVAYIMLHSLAHLLITAISLECGYPLSSLRERIYAPDAEGSMAGYYGILIYTSASGSEGTLGGLVHAARDIRRHLLIALQMGSLCSNDPVCSSGVAGHGGTNRIEGSACHGCLYISETSCERFNQFLDRSLVVPTVDNRGCEFFSI